MPHTPSVSICFFIGVGSRYESDAKAGVSHFIEHMLFKGTLKRPTAREISTAIEGVGGILNGGTDKELTLYWCKVAQPHFELALDVLTDMLLNARFDPREIEKERQVIIEEINMSQDSPEHRVDMLIDELLWPAHPLGRDIAGSKETVAAVTRETMRSYQRGGYLPHNTVVAIAGNIPHGTAVTAVTKALGSWAGPQKRPRYKAYRAAPAPHLRIEKKDTEQVHLRLALPGLSALHPQRFTLDLLNVILGEGMGSRLFTEIRDNLGLVYNISSYAEHFLDSGSVTVAAGVEPKNLTAVIKAILNELSRLREKVPEAELAQAREQTKGRLLLRMENSRNVAGWLGAQEILTGHILTIDQVVAIIDAITTDELEKLAQELLDASQLRLAVVGRVAADEPLAELLRL